MIRELFRPLSWSYWPGLFDTMQKGIPWVAIIWIESFVAGLMLGAFFIASGL